MLKQCVTGIVVRYTNYGENDRILTLFTQELGRIDAKSRGCRRHKSALLAASQLFVFGEYELFESKGKWQIDQCDVRESFYPLREDVERFSAGSCMLSLALHAIQEGQPNAALFSLLYYSLSFLAYGESQAVDLVLCFIVRYLYLIGYCPTIVTCSICGKDIRTQNSIYFSNSAGGAVCGDCRGGAQEISKLSLEAMRRMLLLEDIDLQKVRLPEKVRHELLQILDTYCSYTLENQSKAIDFLRSIF